MWRPPERIRHEARSGHWPSAAEAAASRLFSEVQVGTVKLAQRTWVPAMVPWRASEEGLVTPDVLDWYECFARGRPGAIVVEATGIRDVPSGPLLRIGHDRFLPGLRDLARVVRDASNGETRLVIQLIDFLSIRRRPGRIGLGRARAGITGVWLSRASDRHASGPCSPSAGPIAGPIRRCRTTRSRCRLRRRRTPLRARLHNGFISFSFERPRRRLWRRYRQSREASARSVLTSTSRSRSRLRSRLSIPGRRVHLGRLRRARCGLLRM